ncbi:MAG: hypothetical protein Q4F27_02295 [Desulfovibrionaceae bacterium]|nr:hypothetical protein [Desulfovibrionaceae bacterium]
MRFFHFFRKRPAPVEQDSPQADAVPVATPSVPQQELTGGAYLGRYFRTLLGLAAICLLLIVPYTCWWLHHSGDLAVERAVAAQSQGHFALFGSGVSQDFVDYKLQLYAAVKPEIAVIGSSRVMQFRGAYFRKPFLNMGGVAGNLAVLRSTIDAMLRSHRPEAVILGLDFWWFLPQWEARPFTEVPPTSGSYTCGLESLKKPWAWLLEGKISPLDLARPLLSLGGMGFREDRYGIMAQQTDDGFGPDGSWYYTAEITGQKPPFDYQFHDTLDQVRYGIKAFYRARAEQLGPDTEHLDALAEICCRLKARGIQLYVFIAPLSLRVLEAMRLFEDGYPHLFRLREALAARGLDVLDFTDPRSFASGDCEFVDGFHGGEIAYARILQRMADRWPALLSYVNMERIEIAVRDWAGHALLPDTRLTALPETDFNRFGCPKRVP